MAHAHQGGGNRAGSGNSSGEGDLLFAGLFILRTMGPGGPGCPGRRDRVDIDRTLKNMTGIIAVLTKIIYFITAVILSILALVSFVAAGFSFLALLGPGELTANLLQVLHAILVTIIIVEILETVTAYFKTSRVLVRPILVAGLTAMVRRVIIVGVETINPTDTLVTVAVIAVLTAAVVLVGKEELQEEKPC
jgi:uncharacterized membrane protein (DUF373 family)